MCSWPLHYICLAIKCTCQCWYIFEFIVPWEDHSVTPSLTWTSTTSTKKLEKVNTHKYSKAVKSGKSNMWRSNESTRVTCQRCGVQRQFGHSPVMSSPLTQTHQYLWSGWEFYVLWYHYIWDMSIHSHYFQQSCRGTDMCSIAGQCWVTPRCRRGFRF